MDFKALKTYQKYKDKIALSESVYETAYTEGVMEGIEQGKIELILNGFKKGLSVDFISEIINLPQEKVYNILKDKGLL